MLPLVSVPTPSAGKGERERERAVRDILDCWFEGGEEDVVTTALFNEG